MIGGGGADVLDGATGRDRLTGSGGRDTFEFAAGSTVDRVVDFRDGIDALDFSAFGFASFSQVLALAFNNAAGALRVGFGGVDTLIIDNFAKANFDAGDVIL